MFEGGSKWYVTLRSGEPFRVQEIYAGSEKDDYVIFNVDLDGKKINPIPLYEGEVEKAEEIFVVGNPEGLESSLSTGVVAALREDFWDMDLIQITAPISSGSSGSPVMTMQGEAIGIATLKKIGCENCNFAINIDLIKAALKQL
ncbi:MAG: serine protease [Bacteroidota bacterium]